MRVYQHVLEEDARLDSEISKLSAKKLELQRQLDEVTVELQVREGASEVGGMVVVGEGASLR